MAQKHQHYLSLDAYRGVAAMLVAVIHISQEWKINVPPNNFSMAVDFFFLLSGFVIALSYERKLAEGQIALVDFIKLRLMRLYPMIFLAAIIGIGCRIVEARFSPSAIAFSGIAALLLIPVPRFGGGQANSYPINGPSWSLTHEMIANIAFAIFSRFLKNDRVLITVTLFFAIIEVCVGVRTGRLDFSVSWFDQGYAMLRALAPFLLGVLLFRATRKWKVIVSDVVPLMGGALLALVLFVPFENVYYSLVCVYLIFPCLIFAGLAQPKSRILIAIFAFLGEISYPLYAINQPLARSLGFIVDKSSKTPHLEIMMGLALLAAIAFAISRIYDIPVRAMLRRKQAPAH